MDEKLIALQELMSKMMIEELKKYLDKQCICFVKPEEERINERADGVS